jgi:predicted aspartyl protease
MFTVSGSFSSHIHIPIKVFPISYPLQIIHPLTEKEGKTYEALLDTGATKTSISCRVVKDLNLPPLQTKEVQYTANGLRTALSFLVHIVFFDANKTMVKTHSLQVTDFESENIDVLLGMDIIGQCHLTITPDRYYCMSF